MQSHPVRPDIKIMHVVNSLNLGGTEKALLKLTDGLSSGFEHSICCIRGFDSEFVQAAARRVKIVALNLRPARFSLFVPALMRVFRASKPDIVHSRNWGSIEAVLAARLVGIPVVIHSEHGYEIESLSGTPARQRWMRKLAWPLADAVFTVSRELREFHAAQAGFSADKIRVLWNGVDVNKFAPAPAVRARVRSSLGISADDFVVGAVGRAVPIKDYATLLRAAEGLARVQPNFKLILAGDGPELVRLRELAQSLPGLRDRFLPLGRRGDVPAVLAAMDVFVQTSLGEGMSNTVLEAMASGLAPVVTRVGGNPEILSEQCGWLFDPGDVARLSQVLCMLAVDRNACSKVGLAARKRVEESFSNQAMLDRYRQLYLELAGKRRLVPGRGWSKSGLQSSEVSGA